MEKKSGRMSYVLTEALVWMGALQAALWGMKWLLLPLFPDTRVAYKLFMMDCMLLLTGVVVAYGMKTGNCYTTCLLHGLMNLLSICHVWWESSLGDTIH